MTAQPSQTRIWNNALILLGSSTRISSITDTRPAAKAFAAVWEETRDEVLADHPWNEALERAALAASADYDLTRQTEWDYAYELPADCLRWLPWRRDHENWFAGVLEGRYILSSDEAPIYVRYIRRLEDMARWSPGLNAAITAKLASKCCTAITGSSRRIGRCDAVYEDELVKAKRQDGHATGDRQRNANFRSTWNSARGQSWNGQ